VNFLVISLTAKRLEVLKQLAPAATSIGFLVNPTNLATEVQIKSAESAARSLGVRLVILQASTPDDIEAAFASLVGRQLNTFAVDDQEEYRRVAAFLQALQPLGWTIGRNVEMEQRWRSGDPAGMRKNAEELVALAPDVILTNGAAGVAPLLQATRGVPIVFVLVADPVGAGFVDSLAHPGGNATGFMSTEYGFAGKQLEFLKEIAPSVTRAAVVRDPTISAGLRTFAAIQSVAPSLGVDGIIGRQQDKTAIRLGRECSDGLLEFDGGAVGGPNYLDANQRRSGSDWRSKAASLESHPLVLPHPRRQRPSCRADRSNEFAPSNH
jgi:ABC-type uncharacterized transport system substrate-binding protein